MKRAPPLAQVASVTQRLGVLLGAGVTPASAWGYVAEGATGPVPAAVATAAPARIAQAIVSAAQQTPPLEAAGWRGLAAAWAVATEMGSPLAPALRHYAESLRDLAQVQRDIDVALAAPVATSRVVLVLPAVGMIFGMLMGFDSARVLFATTPGWVCLVAGLALVGGAVAWMRRLVSSAQPRDVSPGLACELLAIAVSGGGSLERATALVDATLTDFALPPAGEGVAAVLVLSQRAGVPAAQLLHSEADEQRRAARSLAQESAAALSVRLLLPLGLCVLPAFMLLGVVPLLVSVLSSTVGSF